MNMLWHGKSGLARATAILATLLLVSLGLCGTNFVVMLGVARNSGSDTTTALVFTGFVELAGILIGVIGLLVVAAIALVRTIWKKHDPPAKKDKAE